MRQGKFAPVTAALLARKGEARPWGYVGAQTAPELNARFYSLHAAAPLHEEHANDVSPSPVAATGDGMRRLTLRVSQADYERLGLIAAKRDLTRQRLLHRMLDDFLAGAAHEYGAQCGCIGGSCRHRG
ncbi:MAG TPA: hypothetical protein VN935_05170 [Rhizomicrobium sp.]|jgi:hypothetical protein|nr:hypothetical protein [Rhizomicrobium sp.]